MQKAVSQRKVGVILSYGSEAIQILTGLIYTPIMLRILGQSEYGLYQLVYSIVSYMNLFSLGFGSSYMRFYSRYKARNDHEEIARLNGMFLTIFTVIAIICIACGIVLLTNIETVLGGGLTETELATARILMIFMVMNMAVSFPASVFNCYITSQEQFVFQKGLVFLQRILNPFLALPLLLMGYGSIGMVSVTTLLTFSTFFSSVWYCIIKLKMKFMFKGFRFTFLKEMWTFTFFIFLNQIIDQINWNLDKFLLGRMVGTAGVAIYSLGAQINTMYMQFSTSISNVFVPKVNQIVAETNDNKTLSELFSRIGRVQFIILSLVLSGFVVFGKPFMIFWGGAGYEESYGIALLLIGPATVPLIQNMGLEIQRAKNMHKARSVVYLAVVLANVGLSVYLIRTLGVSGAAIGTAVSVTAGTIVFMNWYYHFRIGLDIVMFWKNIAKLIPAVLLSLMFGMVMRRFVAIHNVMILGICICVYTLVFGLAIWFLGMNQYEKQLFSNIFNRNKR